MKRRTSLCLIKYAPKGALQDLINIALTEDAEARFEKFLIYSPCLEGLFLYGYVEYANRSDAQEARDALLAQFEVDISHGAWFTLSVPLREHLEELLKTPRSIYKSRPNKAQQAELFFQMGQLDWAAGYMLTQVRGAAKARGFETKGREWVRFRKGWRKGWLAPKPSSWVLLSNGRIGPPPNPEEAPVNGR